MKQIYQRGDIGGTPNRSNLGKANTAIFEPHTELFHFFMIDEYIEAEDDYITIESTANGIGPGRLSWYPEYRIFRLNRPDSAEIGQRAYYALTVFGQAPYDKLLFVKLFAGCLKVWSEHLWSIVRYGDAYRDWWVIRPEELPYGRNSSLICTEGANEGYLVIGEPIIKKGVIPLPAGFIQALYIGKLVEILSDGTSVEIKVG